MANTKRAVSKVYIRQVDRIRVAHEAAMHGAPFFHVAAMLGIARKRAAQIAGIQILPCRTEGAGRG